MRNVKGKDTKPEMALRRMLHRSGYRYRLHRGDLPGKPDLVFPSRRKIILVHGCFWHRHSGCKKASIPKSNTEFWTAKFKRNLVRDAEVSEALAAQGWKVLVVWQCELAEPKELLERVVSFLEDEE